MMQCDEEEESWRCENHTFDVEAGRKESTKERAEVAEKGLKVMNSAGIQREWMKQWV